VHDRRQAPATGRLNDASRHTKRKHTVRSHRARERFPDTSIRVRLLTRHKWEPDIADKPRTVRTVRL